MNVAPRVFALLFAVGLTACTGNFKSSALTPAQATLASVQTAGGMSSQPRSMRAYAQSRLPPQATSDTTTTRLYASLLPDTIVIFDPKTGAIVGNISGGMDGPQGLFLDRSGLLYVANYGPASGSGNGFVTVYEKGASGPVATYPQGSNETAQGVAVATNGTMYVLDELRIAGEGCRPAVEVYPPGSSSPKRTLSFLPKTNCFSESIALDGDNNVYVSYRTNPSANIARIVKFRPGASNGTTITLRHFGSDSGLAIDKAGNVLINGCVPSASNICGAIRTWLFAPGQNSPTRTLTPQPFAGANYGIAFTPNQQQFYVASPQQGVIYAFSYGRLKLVQRFLIPSSANVRGIAVGNGP